MAHQLDFSSEVTRFQQDIEMPVSETFKCFCTVLQCVAVCCTVYQMLKLNQASVNPDGVVTCNQFLHKSHNYVIYSPHFWDLAIRKTDATPFLEASEILLAMALK